MTEPFKISLTGDSILTRSILSHPDTKELKQAIAEADTAFTNLEVLPNDFRGHPAARTDGAHLAARSWVLDELKSLGFDLFGCANNHSLDYGVDGLLTTIEELEKRNISYAGIGKNLAEAAMPVYVERNGRNVAMLSCTSTFYEEQAAGEQTAEMQGRPGTNPLHVDIEYQVTSDQFANLQRIYEDLGLEEQRQVHLKLGFAPKEEDKDVLPFVDMNYRVHGTLNAKFRRAEKTKVETKPRASDLEYICRWVKDAKARAEIVMLSLHAHEQEGADNETPAEFIRTFAKAAIDAGADVIIGHGPHLLRGMEMYKGKAIFYSLGNIIGQNELIEQLPHNSYKRFNIDAERSPSELFDIRSEGGTKGFPGNDLYWQTVMPVCSFNEDGTIAGIEIIPVKLTHGSRPYERGRPFVAKGKEAERIIHKFQALSKPFDTEVIFENNRGYLKI